MGFGENMPLDVLFVRDDDIPDLVQEDVCDLGLVGLNVLDCVASPREMLAGVVDALRPGGSLVLSTPYDWSPSATPAQTCWSAGCMM